MLGRSNRITLGKMDRESGSVEVGACLLEVGNQGGTIIGWNRGGEEAEIESLCRALERPEPKAEERTPALVSEIDEAGETTSRIEQATALCRGAAEGHALDPDQLALEVGTLLDCLERLDREKKHAKAIQMARSLSTLLMLLKRWASLLQTLRIALRAGQGLGDEAAVAWANHELGTLKLAAGDVEGADRDLRRAHEIRKRIGDRPGMAATSRNMQALCERLRNMVRDEELVRRERRSGRAALLRTFSLAALIAALFGGGVAAGMIAGGDSGTEPVAEEATGTPDHSGADRHKSDGAGSRAAGAGPEESQPTAPETVTTVETVTTGEELKSAPPAGVQPGTDGEPSAPAEGSEETYPSP